MLPTDADRRIEAHVVCGGRWHDFDHARHELLGHLASDERIRTTVASDHRDLHRLRECELLVTYTCDIRPTSEQVSALRAWVAGGGTWLALHGTNAALTPTDGGWAPVAGLHDLWALLGSHFLAHPPAGPHLVTPVDGDHPLVAGIGPFEVSDELYLMELPDPDGIEVLATARFTGEAPSFTVRSWPVDEPRPVLYTRFVGAGRIWYCTLGHCRGRFDLHPEVEIIDKVDRGSWDVPAFRDLLDRGLRWATGPPGSGDSPTTDR